MFLGAINASPLDVAQIYSTLAASGYLTPLLAIREVMTKDGQPLSRYSFQLKQTLPEGPVYLTNWAMQKVIEFGTGRWAVSVLPAGQSLRRQDRHHRRRPRFLVRRFRLRSRRGDLGRPR